MENKQKYLINKMFSMLILESLEENFKHSGEYKKIAKERIDISRQYMDMDFSVKDRIVIDDLLEKVERYEMAHGDYAYKAGFYVCIDVLKILGQLQ